MTHIHKRNGVYVVDIKVPKGPKCKGSGVEVVEKDTSEVFRRLGADLV